jgi:serine/threonine protein kinase
MQTIKIKYVKNTGFDSDFDAINTLQIDDQAFSEGGFGRIYHCRQINNAVYANPQVIKIFKDNGQGSADHSFKTISELQEKIIQSKAEYEAIDADFLKQYPAFFGAPQFVFTGELNGNEVRGYSANNLIHFGYICFTDVINNQENQEEYLQLPVETIYAKAYHLSRAFALLNEFAYIHADFKTDNFFVSLMDARCALIDFDSGAFIHDLTDEPYTWGTPQDMLAPEIFEQMADENSIVRVNLLSDMWSVAVAMHYLIFNLHPLFFVSELSRDSITKYISNFSWPQIDKASPLFNQEMEPYYEWYCSENVFHDLPIDICNCFRHTVMQGYFEPANRTTYNQWIIKLQPLISEKERRYSFSKLKHSKEKENNPEPEKEEKEIQMISESEYPGYIADLVEKLIDKQTFLYEHKEELNATGQMINKPDLYDRVDNFLLTYYDIISDGIITPIERRKLKFKGNMLGISSDIVEQILNKAI